MIAGNGAVPPYISREGFKGVDEIAIRAATRGEVIGARIEKLAAETKATPGVLGRQTRA